ncbi:MAG: HigA family addiction module antidote protein [Nitrospirae bacterium]|nr:HigA family addiction module antidote protein [Nitrospirota bacterium]MBF0534853.1 HigA family addiction module antidote protein [Nitrospirota bacterium]MBF0616768.1 HigA family addiction module antidote protein [Nitrospirota bacterium]
MESKVYKYNPDYAVSPGEILEEHLAVKKMKKSDFAKQCNLNPMTISRIISGKCKITPEMADKFERILEVPASVWNNLESSYRLHIALSNARTLTNLPDVLIPVTETEAKR